MNVLFENRTISMILMVPDVEGLSTSESPSSMFNKSDGQLTIKQGETSMPVYHGSIVGIERAADDRNASNLIVRVPNFQHFSLPSMMPNGDKSIQFIGDHPSTFPRRVKRRAPICPIVNNSPVSSPVQHRATSSLHSVKTQRLTSGLRSISRALTHGCRSKRSTSISEVTYPSSLPDVEVMKERLPQSKHSMMPKLSTPKILLLKRKQMKVKEISFPPPPSSSPPPQSSSSRPITPTPAYAEVKKNITKTTSFIHQHVEKHFDEIDFDDRDQSKQTISMDLVSEVTQSFPTLSQLVPSMPTASTDAISLSTHRYSTISAIVTDIRNIVSDHEQEEFLTPQPSTPTSIGIPNQLNKPFRVQTSILQPDISVIRFGMIDVDRPNGISQTIPECLEQEEEENRELERFSECYEVTYQLDSEKEFQHHLNSSSSPTLKLELDPNEYRNLATALTDWFPQISSLKPSNIYEQIENEKISSHESLHHSSTPIKSHSADDLSQNLAESSNPSEPLSPRHCVLRRSKSYDGFGVSISSNLETGREHLIHQVEEKSPGDRAGLKENDRILCINGTSIIDEDYTVVLHLLRESFQNDHLDIQVMSNEAYEEFHQQKDSSTTNETQ